MFMKTQDSAIPSFLTPLSAVDGAVVRRRTKGLVSEIVAAVQADLDEGRLVPGDKLPTESALVARFEVSRTVVREAISRLQAAGLVETRHGIGTFVRQPETSSPFRLTPEDYATVADVISLLELRISLESEAAALAAQRREAQHLDAMALALDGFQDAMRQDLDAVPSDFQFHVEIARATGNRHFADLMTYLGTVIIPRTRLKTADMAPEGRLAYLQRVHAEHESILAAIRQGDADMARAAMRTHLSNSRDRLRRAQALDVATAGPTSGA